MTRLQPARLHPVDLRARGGPAPAGGLGQWVGVEQRQPRRPARGPGRTISIATIPPIDSPASAKRGGASASTCAASACHAVVPGDSAAMHRTARRQRRDLRAEQPRVAHHAGQQDQRQVIGRQRRPFGQRRQLGIGDIGIDRAKAREGAEAAIGLPAITRSATDDIGEPFEPLRHQFRVFDEIGRRIDHAGHQHLVVGNIAPCGRGTPSIRGRGAGSRFRTADSARRLTSACRTSCDIGISQTCGPS